MSVVLIDDQMLGRVLRGDTPTVLRHRTLATTGLWYLRLCQATLGSSGVEGVLSRPFAMLTPRHRAAAVDALNELPEPITLVSLRLLAPVMARLRADHTLNLLAMEALAAAQHLDADEVVLSAPSPRLERALAVEGIAWSRTSA